MLLILAGVSIATLTGPNGLITNANHAKLKTEVAQLEEELELFKAWKVSENNGFIADTLNADKEKVSYNTKSDNKENNIDDILTSLDEWKYKENIEISKGKLIFVSQDLKLIEMAKKLGLTINPYEIVDGELKSSESNLALMDSTGTLTLPSNITKIGEGAFSNVEGLKTIIIPGTCKIIGKNAFAHNSTLEKVIIEDGVEIIENYAFRECNKLHTVEMANAVTQIGELAFYNDFNLKNINLSTGITTLGQYAFYNCAFQEIIIPNGIEKIEMYTFYSCVNLEKIILPEKLSKIDSTVFSGCKKLKDIQINENNKDFIFENGILMSANREQMIIILESAITGNIFSVPKGVKTLESDMLSNYPQITTVDIPSSTIMINPGFINTNITKVNIDSNNTKYETYNNAIYEKNNGVKEILIRYYGIENDVKIEEGIKEIGNMAFLSKAINKISLPDSLEEIGNQSFAGTNFTQLSLGINVQKLDPLFLYNSKVTNLIINQDNPNYIVENNILYNKDRTQGIKELILPIYPIGTIQDFEIPEGVTKIGDYAFHSQDKMKSVKIPKTVTEIGNSFNYCYSLQKIEIPNSVTKISKLCFNSSSNLNEIIINKKEGSIEGAPWGAVKGERVIKWIK